VTRNSLAHAVVYLRQKFTQGGRIIFIIPATVSAWIKLPAGNEISKRWN